MSGTWLNLAAAVGFAFCALGDRVAAQMHTSPMAGKWYPAEKADLEKLLDQAFEAAGKRAGDSPVRSELRALVAPHAALPYSGVIAASAYRLVNRPDNVILLGFSHTRELDGVAAPDVEAYETPLGRIAVNREALRELAFPLMKEEKLCDHSLENHLPFVQRAAPGAEVIPLYVGTLSGKALTAAARKLAARLKQGDLLIASSDFTHYGEAHRYTPYANDGDLPKRLFRQAMLAFEEIGSLDVKQFEDYLAATEDTICGREPIRLLMATLSRLDDTYMEAVDYVTSGDLTHDYSVSVSYGAMAFYPASAFRVGAADQQRLLRSARSTLDQYLADGVKIPVPVPLEQRGPDLQQRAGVFVTLRKKGELRGCVGTLVAHGPLWDTVAERTLAVIASDPRFPPLTAKEGPVTLEVSLLTPLKKIKDWRHYRPGLGAALAMGGKQGVLLPQVAEELEWNSQRFLENLSMKAGLPPKAYRDPKARLYVYDTQVLNEIPGQTITPAGGFQQ